jgi:hypothetical protein
LPRFARMCLFGQPWDSQLCPASLIAWPLSPLCSLSLSTFVFYCVASARRRFFTHLPGDCVRLSIIVLRLQPSTCHSLINMANTATPTMATPIDFNSVLDTSNLKDRSVLITGAASGIGLACAMKMAEAGAIVTMADLHDTAGGVIQGKFWPCELPVIYILTWYSHLCRSNHSRPQSAVRTMRRGILRGSSLHVPVCNHLWRWAD